MQNTHIIKGDGNMETATNFLIDQCLVLIPVLYIIGAMLKGTNKISDKYIPFILVALGILFAIALTGLNAQAVIQGILVTGVTVYGNQLIKQIGKNE